MALTDESNGGIPATMLVGPTNYPAPIYQGGMNSGFGDGNGGWWILLLILLLAGGWNNGNNANNGGFASGGNGGLYPWMNQAEITNNGFQNQLLNDNITSIRDGITGISTQLCNGFASVNSGVANGFAQAEISNNARQIANMQQSFANQTAMMQGFNNLQSQFADCCCENRLANCQTQNIIQNEGNATRFADANNTRDLLANQTASTQAILDKLCQLELDGVKAQVDAKNDRIAELQAQLNMANLAASQTAQTAQILAGQTAEIDGVYNRLKNCPVPSMPVYGNTPIFSCGNNGGCGCGSF